MGCHCSQGSNFAQISKSYSQLVLLGDNVIATGQAGVLAVKPIAFPTFASAVYVNEREIYVTGGITSLGKVSGLSFQGTISCELIRYRLDETNQSNPPTQFLKPMATPRYAHSSTVLFNKLFVIGGRTYEQSILDECQCYDLIKGQWQQIGGLNVARTCASTVIFRQKIYVFGGYNGQQRRSRKIQRFNKDKNQWEVLPFKLPLGLEATLVMPSTYGKFIVFGGNSNGGASNSVYLIDLTNETVQARPSLIKPRYLAKGYVKGQSAFIFGGCEDHSVEIHSLSDDPAKPQLRNDLNLSGLCTPLQLRSYAQALTPCIVHQAQQQQSDDVFQFQPIRSDETGCVLFGTDAQPFLVSFNFSTNRAHRRAVDLRFQLRMYQSSIGTAAGVLVTGGVNNCLTKVSKKCYLYRADTDQVKRTGSMITGRYGHGLIRFNDLIFAVGGKSKGQESLLSSVQCWQQGKWLQVGQMKKKRSSPGLSQLNDGFIIYGGYGGNGVRLNDIQVYSVKRGFVLVQAKLPLPIQGPATVRMKQQLFIFGGRMQDGDSEQVWKATHSIPQDPIQRTFDWQMSHAGKISRGRALPKVYFNQRSEVFLFGIPNGKIQIFSLKFCTPVKREHLGLEGVLEGFEDLLGSLQDQLCRSYSLAQTDLIARPR